MASISAFMIGFPAPAPKRPLDSGTAPPCAAAGAEKRPRLGDALAQNFAPPGAEATAAVPDDSEMPDADFVMHAADAGGAGAAARPPSPLSGTAAFLAAGRARRCGPERVQGPGGTGSDWEVAAAHFLMKSFN